MMDPRGLMIIENKRRIDQLEKEIKKLKSSMHIDIILFITLFLFVTYVALFK